MSKSHGGHGTLAQQAGDAARAAWAAVWTRSASAREVSRLREEGCLPGETCELAFSFAFDAGDAGVATAARASLAAAGFAIVDAADAARGFLTVSLPIALGAGALARAESRIRRIAAQHGGHAELIGSLAMLGQPAVLEDDIAARAERPRRPVPTPHRGTRIAAA